MNSMISHPSHYNSGKFEVIEVIEDQGWGLQFCLGNAIKYTCRAGKKNPATFIEDLQKATWYLKRAIESLEAESQGRSRTRPNDMNPRSTSATDASSSGASAKATDTAQPAPTAQCYEAGRFEENAARAANDLLRPMHTYANCGRCGVDVTNPAFDRSQCKLCSGGRDLANAQPGSNRMGINA